MHPLLAYALGLVTIPLAMALFSFAHWSLSRDWSGGGCDFCTHAKDWDRGRVTNLRFWLNAKAHSWLWARLPAHRQAAGDRWREHTAKGWQTRQWSDRYMK